MTRVLRSSVGALLAAALLAACGCGGARRSSAVTFHDENMDFSLIRTVAVMPFDNLSATRAAEQRVRDVFMTMLQATGSMYVLPPGEVNRGISRAGIENPIAPTAEEIVTFGGITETDAVILGSVLEYGETRSGSAQANFISLSVRMIETQTGRVVWSASSTRGGVDAGDRLFGGGGQPMNDVTAKAIQDLLDKLFR